MNKKLRAAREKIGMTQEQVASAARVGVRLYQEYEYGRKAPSVFAAIRIAKALNSTVEEIFGKEGTTCRR